MDKTTMETFFKILMCRKESVENVEKKIKILKVKEIWPFRIGNWKNEVLFNYLEILKEYVIRKSKDYKDYKDIEAYNFFKYRNFKNEKELKRTFKVLFEIYDSIKKHGYKKIQNEMIEVIDVRSMPHSEYDNRMSKNWYRLNGEHRLAVCYFRGIYMIPCKVFKVKIHPW